MRALAVGVWLLTLAGCHGEAIEPGSQDAAAADATSCSNAPDNLIANGSFEQWNEGTPVGWSGSGTISRLDAAAYECNSALRLVAKPYESIQQDLTLSGATPAGARLEMTVAVRWVSGGTVAPNFHVSFWDDKGGSLGDVHSARMDGFAVNGAWHVARGTLPIPSGATRMRLTLAVFEGAQTIDLDAVSVRVTP